MTGTINTNGGIKNNGGWLDFYNGSTHRGSIYSNYPGTELDIRINNGSLKIIPQGGSYEYIMVNSWQEDSGYRQAIHSITSNQLIIGTYSIPANTVIAVNGYTQVSDKNKKRNISYLDNKIIDFIMTLKPCSYQLLEELDSDNKIHYGMIAQDIEDTIDSVSDFAYFIKSNKKSEDDKVINNEYDYSLSYTEFIAPLIKMVQIQQDKINELEKRISALE